MNAKLKYAFFSTILFILVVLWAGTVSASPFLMMPEMHTNDLHCSFAAAGEMACPMNLVEQIDQWSDSISLLPILDILLVSFLTTSGFVSLVLIILRVAIQASPPGVSWLERKQELWALSQGILNPKRPHMLQV